MVLPVVPVTSACNLNCPVCYTINKNKTPYFITREKFKEILAQIQVDDPDMRLINFTGGEPLMHPQFVELVKMCREAGIHRITLSTNGLRFLEDETLLERLTELDARIVLSFNSFQRAPYIATAGKDLLEEKLNILSLLEKHKPSTTLLSVAAFGINDQEIGDIVAYVMGSDFIVSSEIHTVTFTGQNVDRFAQTTRLTIPDVISGIVRKNP
ncbi:MAG: radical SAM protein, partial [bacterium]|nr:radical SAM protein [bacterium]